MVMTTRTGNTSVVKVMFLSTTKARVLYEDTGEVATEMVTATEIITMRKEDADYAIALGKAKLHVEEKEAPVPPAGSWSAPKSAPEPAVAIVERDTEKTAKRRTRARKPKTVEFED